MKTLKDHSLVLLVLVFIQCCFTDRFSAAVFVLLCAYWRIRVRKMLPAVCLILSVILFPRTMPFPSDIREAVITDVKENYCIASKGMYRLIIYTDEIMPFDAEIEILAEPAEINPSYSFYGFDAEKWCRSCGTDAYVRSDQIEITKLPSFSIRYWMQKRIEQIPDAETKAFLYSTLLRISDTDNEEAFFTMFSAAAAVMILEAFLKLFISEKYRNRIIVIYAFLLCLIYRFEFACTQIFLFRLYRQLYPDDLNTCPVMVICLLLYPSYALSASFLIPAAYRLSRFTLHPRINGCTAVMMIESYLYHSVSCLKIIFFPLLMRIRGLAWLLSVLQLFCTISFIMPVIKGISVISRIQSFALKGSWIGAGLPFFLLSVWSFRKNRHMHILVPFMFVVFLSAGLFHPFAEITFINVSQGDAILIRNPLNMHNIMIDTGRPSQYSAVKDILDAKSVYTVDTLIITHPDSDHNGNEADVCEDYHVKNLYTEHHEALRCGFILMHDLNDIADEDENRSSLTEYFRMNGMDILCMGDADEITEERMVRKFNDLTCDILKLSHHGSKTGSSDIFLDQTRPAFGIVSSGPYSMYHHPSPETVQRLMLRSIPYFDTKEEGDITILCMPFVNVMITTSKKMIFLPAG